MKIRKGYSEIEQPFNSVCTKYLKKGNQYFIKSKQPIAMHEDTTQ